MLEYLMLNWWHFVVLGVVEGVTEFLPISSTAHLILTAKLLGLRPENFLKSFEIIIQTGAIVAVVILYWRSLIKLEVLKRLAVAFIPTGALGLIFYPFIKIYLLGSTMVVLWALGLGGAALILFETYYSAKRPTIGEPSPESLTYRQCVGVGLFQAVAMIPGVSRAAATMMGGMLLGVSRRTVVEFSFLLAVPTMLAATGLDVVKNFQTFSSTQVGFLLLGFLVSLLMAVVSIKFLLRYISQHNFTVFGLYRLVLVGLFLLLVI